jgi:hypothetical protein
MTVQIPNTVLGVRRVDPTAVDAHGSPLPAEPGEPSALLPGKATELDTGQWQLALDPSLWPVRVGDRVIDDTGASWVATYVKLLQSPPLAADEQVPGIDMDIAFIRVMAEQVTPAGTEPVDSNLVGRIGLPL